MTSRIYAYLRASTTQQDVACAKGQLDEFVATNGMITSGYFAGNESGTSLKRPELFRLLKIAQKGDVLLVEQIGCLSRLSGEDWSKLRLLINKRGVRAVALDLLTSHQLIQSGDESASGMLEALNEMMLDMLAAIAKKDYTDRKKRQVRGIARAKSDGKYRDRPEDTQRNERIAKLLQAGMPYSDVTETIACLRVTVARVSRSLRELA